MGDTSPSAISPHPRGAPLLLNPPCINTTVSSPSSCPVSPGTPRTHNLHPNTDDVLLLQPPHQHHEIPSTPFSTYSRYMASAGWGYFVVFFITAAGMVYGVSQKYFTWIDWTVEKQVAFLGNSYLIFNDVPRLLEAMSTGHVYQNSCVHPGGSLSDLWITGNGMYSLWQSQQAEIEYSVDGGTATTYDFGLCTVAQLLQGYDEYIAYGNSAGHYYDDGLNPCIVNPYYASFLESHMATPETGSSVHWDYVVLVDQTKRMAIPQARNDTLQALVNGYAPFLQACGAIPVIIDTHAFWSDSSNMTGLVDIPTFTQAIYQGVQEYTAALKKVLPKRQAPLVAPIGLAYLTVWEENYALWTRLFLDNRIHASVSGSYLLGVVLYCTLFGHLPEENLYVPYLFEDARYLMGPAEYPTAEQVQYLRKVAQRVVLKHYVPPSFYR